MSNRKDVRATEGLQGTTEGIKVEVKEYKE
jgi:hypothetical protein